MNTAEQLAQRREVRQALVALTARPADEQIAVLGRYVTAGQLAYQVARLPWPEGEVIWQHVCMGLPWIRVDITPLENETTLGFHLAAGLDQLVRWLLAQPAADAA